MTVLNKIYRKAQRVLFNNIPVNRIRILLHKDHLAKIYIKNWQTLGYDSKATALENSGITQTPEILQTLQNCHDEIQKIYTENLHNKGRILDIGCGPGLFLNDFKDSTDELWGVDMNPDFIRKAKTLVPKAHLIEGDFLSAQIPGTFKLIYSSSVLMYIERSQIKAFFDKIYQLLDQDGFLCIHYPHALQWKDLLYHDLSYIRYSPAFLEKILGDTFSIIKHEHLYDQRKVKKYDHFHYYYPDGTNKRLDTLQNSYILIAQKK